MLRVKYSLTWSKKRPPEYVIPCFRYKIYNMIARKLYHSGEILAAQHPPGPVKITGDPLKKW